MRIIVFVLILSFFYLSIVRYLILMQWKDFSPANFSRNQEVYDVAVMHSMTYKVGGM